LGQEIKILFSNQAMINKKGEIYMKSLKNIVVVAMLVGFLLATISGANVTPKPVNAFGSSSFEGVKDLVNLLTSNSSLTDIVNLLVTSPHRWSALEITYLSDFRYPSEKVVYWSSESNFQLESQGRGLLHTADNGKTTLNWVNDGTNMWTENPTTMTYTQSGLPSVFIDKHSSINEQMQAGTSILSAYDTGALFIPSAFNEYIYPVSIGRELLKTQLSGTVRQDVKIGEMEIICDRQALLIDRIAIDKENSNSIVRWHKYWIDAKTGIFLKVEVIDPNTGEWLQRTVATKFSMDPKFTNDLFVYAPKPSWKLELNHR
jgi:hypothetical protein